MRRHNWVSALAILGVLLHAGALVRHNARMLDAALDYTTLASGLAQFCHGGASASPVPSELPFLPKPSDAQNACPICSGLGFAFALAGPEPDLLRSALQMAAPFLDVAVCFPVARRVLCPPARGPPLLA
jgi:hypothetical protein